MTRPYRLLTNTLADNPKSWLVTGAAGFIGSHLVQHLLQLNQRVVGLDNYSTGRKENIDSIRDAVGSTAFSRFDMLRGDITQMEDCVRACKGVDYVLHQAALGSVPRSIAFPQQTHAANVTGFVHMTQAAHEAQVRRLVYASSSSVYGDHPSVEKVESRVGKPLSPYAATKRANEDWATAVSSTVGLSMVGLRYFNVVGTRQNRTGAYVTVIPRWLDHMIHRRQPEIYGDGANSRDYCPVANVVEANLLAATTPNVSPGDIYNVALGQRTTLDQLFGILQQALGAHGISCAHITPHYTAPRPGDMAHSLANLERITEGIGYQPCHPLIDTIHEIVKETVETLATNAHSPSIHLQSTNRDTPERTP